MAGEKREFKAHKWEYYPPFDGPHEIHSPSCAEDCEAMLYAMEVDVENAAGQIDVTLMLHWDEADFHMVIGEWSVQPGDEHYTLDLDTPLPMTENSNFHLILSNASKGMKVTFRMLMEYFKELA